MGPGFYPVPIYIYNSKPICDLNIWNHPHGFSHEMSCFLLAGWSWWYPVNKFLQNHGASGYKSDPPWWFFSLNTLWFWGFWGSLAPHLVGKYIIPGSLAPPISQGPLNAQPSIPQHHRQPNKTQPAITELAPHQVGQDVRAVPVTTNSSSSYQYKVGPGKPVYKWSYGTPLSRSYFTPVTHLFLAMYKGYI